MGRIINLDARKGGASVRDIVVGVVEVTPTRMRHSGSITVLDARSEFGLSNGKAVLDLAPSPPGDDPAWAYKVTIRDDITKRSVTEYVAVPDGEGELSYTSPLIKRFTPEGGAGTGLVPIETRGDLPDGADVHTYTTSDHVGAWRIIPGRTYYNLPATSLQHGTLEAIKAGSSNTLRVTYFDEMWFAEKPTVNWGGWRKAVTTEGLNLSALRINRGTLPANTNLNTLNDSTSAGIWMLQAGAAYVNAPRESFSQNAQLVVSPSSGYRSTHRVIEFNTEHFRSQPAGVWGNWRTQATTEVTDPLGARIASLESNISSGMGIASRSAILMQASGATDFEKGADTLDIPASMTKMLTAYVARQTLTNAQLDITITLDSGDVLAGSAPQLEIGDVISYRSLFYLAMLPSHNVASEILAARVGATLPGTAVARDRFLAAMNTQVSAWGWTGAVFTSASGLGASNRATPRQMAELLWKIANDDPTLIGIMGELSKSISVTGPNARTVTVDHSIPVNGNPGFPDFVAGKTGTLNSPLIGNVAMLVETRGVRRVIVTMGAVPTTDRYPDARRILNTLGLTDLDVPGADVSGLGSHIRIGNTGGMVSLSFAAAKMPVNANVPAAIPSGFRPSSFSYGMLTVRDGSSIRVVEVSLTASGDLILTGNLEGDSLRGMVTWPAA